MTTERHVDITFNESSDLVWHTQDLGVAVGPSGGSEYEHWRTVLATDLVSSKLRAMIR